MGLCKCPRKKVTNLFCFEHRVNVCEHCLLSRHAQCVVQSYLEWLQDSDYDPNCPFCGKALGDEKQPTARLTCLHLYHWHCLNTWAQQFPSNTAPAGYQCPSCRTPVIPKHNTAGPIADALRDQLKQSNWARQGLGLELLPDVPHLPSAAATLPAPVPQPASAHQQHSTSVQIDSESAMVSRKPQQSASEDGYVAAAPPPPSNKRDADAQDNKYKRRSAMEWFSTWIRSRSSGRTSMSDPLLSYKRWLFLLVVLFVGLVTVITILTRVAGTGDEYDPFLDPLANPNIRIGDFERKQDIMGHHI